MARARLSVTWARGRSRISGSKADRYSCEHRFRRQVPPMKDLTKAMNASFARRWIVTCRVRMSENDDEDYDGRSIVQQAFALNNPCQVCAWRANVPENGDNRDRVCRCNDSSQQQAGEQRETRCNIGQAGARGYNAKPIKAVRHKNRDRMAMTRMGPISSRIMRRTSSVSAV